MTVIREADEADGPALVRFFLDTPLQAGSVFVLDRSPDFGALLHLRGRARTFVARAHGRIVGTVTALRHAGYEGAREVSIGEIVDLRVAPGARGGPFAARLLATARDALTSERTSWVLCLIGDTNRGALSLVTGKAGLPALRPLARYASTHFIALRVPLAGEGGDVRVRPAGPADAGILADLVRRLSVHRLFQPREPFTWPDPAGRHRGWIATGADGRPVGALVVWDGMDVRRIRVVRYSASDRWLRAGMRLAALAGAARPLPAPGGALRVWASRWFGIAGAEQRVAKVLVHAAIRAAAIAGQHVLQLNLAEDDPLRAVLPALPRSVYWTTVFAAPFEAQAEPPADGVPMCFADLALV